MLGNDLTKPALFIARAFLWCVPRQEKREFKPLYLQGKILAVDLALELVKVLEKCGP